MFSSGQGVALAIDSVQIFVLGLSGLLLLFFTVVIIVSGSRGKLVNLTARVGLFLGMDRRFPNNWRTAYPQLFVIALQGKVVASP